MSVRVGSVLFENIEEGEDNSSFDSLDKAKDLKSRGFRPVSARVSRMDGLVLLTGPMNHRSEGVHFKSAICGFSGTGPRHTVEILQMFGLRDSSLERVAAHQELVFNR